MYFSKCLNISSVFSIMCLFIVGHTVSLRLHLTFRGLARVAIFTTDIDAENQCLINHKCVREALNRQFCQTAVCTLNGKYSSFNKIEEARE